MSKIKILKTLIIITLSFCLFFTFSFLTGCAKEGEMILEPEEELEEEPLETVEPEEPIEEMPEEEVEGEVAIGEFEWFQTGNTQPLIPIQHKSSKELEDNRIGTIFDFVSPDYYGEPDEFINGINDVGYKRFRLNLNQGTWDLVDWGKEYSKFSIEPHQNKTITGLADNGIKMICVLTFWDVDSPGKEFEEGYSRFKTEEEVERYLEYVRFLVQNFKDRIEYYELWNEPDSTEGTQQYIELADYINLIKRVVPVIREEYPEAKIVVGGTCNLMFQYAQEYTFGILKSDAISLVDGFSFHPMYGTSPQYDEYKEYYYGYPSLIQDIKDTASGNGFNGEYIAEEMCWRTIKETNPDEPWTYSEITAAKYYARGIIIHLGLDITTLPGDGSAVDSPKMVAIQNLCNIMAGAKPASLPVEIKSEAENIRSYSFSLSNGDTLIALWTDGVAVDEDSGIKANITLQGFTAQDVVGVDVLEGFQQRLVASNEKGNLLIQNLIVRDYPLILHITKSSTQN